MTRYTVYKNGAWLLPRTILYVYILSEYQFHGEVLLVVDLACDVVCKAIFCFLANA